MIEFWKRIHSDAPRCTSCLPAEGAIATNHIFQEAVQMTMLAVIELEGNLVVDSRLIAEKLGIKHKNLLETLETYLTKIEEAFGAVAFETREFKTKQGNTSSERWAWLTEDQATLLMTFSRNTPRVVDCKVALVTAFAKAKKVIKEVVPAQSERLRILELENENLKLQLAVAQAQKGVADAQRQLCEYNNAVATLHGAPMLALIQGRPDAVVKDEIEVEKVILCNQSGVPIAISEGVSKSALARRFNLKKSADVVSWLRSVGKDGLLIQGFTAVSCEYVPRSCLAELDRLWAAKKGHRQRLLGE